MYRKLSKRNEAGPSRQLELLESRRLMSAVALTVPNITATQSFDAPVAEISGLPAWAAAPRAVIRWGDGQVSIVNATPLAGTPGEFVAWTPHTYARAGTFRAAVAFREHGKVLGVVREHLIAGKSAATGGGPTGGVTAPAVTGTLFNGVLRTISFPTAPPATFDVSNAQVRIDWGDGTFSNGTLTPVGSNQFQVNGKHLYTSSGTFNVHVRADDDGYPLSPIPGSPEPEIVEFPNDFAFFDLMLDASGPTVTQAPPSVQIIGEGLLTADADTFQGTLATMTGISPDPLGSDVYAEVNWGGGNGLGYVQYQDGQYVISEYNQSFEGLNKHNFPTSAATIGTVTITLLLNDHVDPTKNTVLGTVTDQFIALPNSKGGVTLSLSARQAFSGSIGIITLDPGQTLQNPTIDWGDGSNPDVNVTLTPIGNNQFRVTASHVYASPDRYRILLYGNGTSPLSIGVTQPLASTAIVS